MSWFRTLLLLPGLWVFPAETVRGAPARAIVVPNAETPTMRLQTPPRIDSAGHALRWDNVEGPPVWVKGAPPSWNSSAGSHTVHLEPGRKTLIHLPARTTLRVQRAAGDIVTSEIEVFFSNGSGLKLPLQPWSTDDPRSLCYFPESLSGGLVEVGRPASSSTPIVLALFHSRVWSSGDGPEYRDQLTLPLPRARVARSSLLKRRPFFAETWARAEPSSEFRLSVQGPARLVLSTRLLYSMAEVATLQSYPVAVDLDGEKDVHDLITRPDSGDVFVVDGKREILGADRRIHLEVPWGTHDLRFTFFAPLFCRVLEETPRDFLFQPDKTIPRPQESLVLSRRYLAGPLQWLEDNSVVDGRLLGAMFARAFATRLAATSGERALARSLYTKFSRFRDLTPVANKRGRSQILARFTTPKLLGPLDRRGEVFLLEQHLGKALGFATGIFLDVARGAEGAVRYEIPPRASPSRLRVAVDRRGVSVPTVLRLQFDDEPPIEVRVLPKPELDATHFSPSGAEVGLTAVLSRPDVFAPGGLHGALGSSAVPKPFLPVAVGEISLRQTVREVRVWTESGESAVRVALEYLSSAPFVLTETEFERAARLAGHKAADESPFFEYLGLWHSGLEVPTAGAKLFQYWLPTFRRLEKSAAHFEAGARRVTRFPGGEPSGSSTSRDVEEAVRRAQQREIAGDWLGALEEWGRVAVTVDPELQQRARIGRLGALEALGEYRFLELELRTEVLNASDGKLCSELSERLTQVFLGNGSEERLRGLLAYRLLRHGDTGVIEVLADSFLRTGEFETALQLCLALPQPERPSGPLVRAAFELGWWGTFDRQTAALEDNDRRAFWNGMRSAARFDYAKAVEAFEAAGELGAAYERHLSQALQVRKRLRSSVPEERFKALLDWERLEQEHPGPFLPTDASAFVTGFSGTSVVRTPEGTERRYYVGGKGRPLRLQVLGPTTLKLEARPLHGNEEKPLNGSVEVRGLGGLRKLWFKNNLPVPGLVVVAGHGSAQQHGSTSEYGAILESARSPGQRVVTSIRLGPGLHELEVGGGDLELLLRPLVLQPRTRLGVLPAWTPATFWAALDEVARNRDFAHSADSYSTEVQYVRGTRREVTGRWPAVAVSSFSPSLQRVEFPPFLDPLLCARLALRTGRLDVLSAQAVGLRRLVEGEGDATPEERYLACLRLAEVWGTDATMESCFSVFPKEGPPGDVREAALLEAGEYDTLLRLPVRPGPEGALQRMSSLLHIAETEPELRRHAQVVGDSLFRSQRQTRGLKALFRQLIAGSRWRLMSSVKNSAGRRYVRLARWQPESPSQRLAIALVPPLRDGERLFSGKSRYELELKSGQDSALRVDLHLETLAGGEPAAVRFFYRLDQKTEVMTPLDARRPSAQFSIDVPAGEHVVAFRMEPPVIHQHVRLWVRDEEMYHRGPDHLDVEDADSFSPDPFARDSLSKGQRPYLVATQDQPVVIPVRGPDVVRVDEFRDGETRPKYIPVPDGWTDLKLLPDSDRPEGLFRVFRRELSDEGPVAVPRPSPPPAEPLPSLPVEWLIDEAPPGLLLGDVFRLGGQEDGTITVSASGHRRRIFDEDSETDADRFVQLGLRHRYFSDFLSTFFETGVFTRSHDDFGPTVGAEERVRIRPEWMPFVLTLRASAAAQWPEGSELGVSGGSEWGGLLNATVSRRWSLGRKGAHTPSLTVFGRYLSLDNDLANTPGSLDSDVFSTYKRDHLKGFTIAENVQYEPWQDTTWWGRMAFVSNEDFNPGNPDNVNFTFGWRQYFRGLEVDAGYRATRFFSDGDRLNSRSRDAIFVRALYDLWVAPGHRLEASVDLRHELGNGENVGFFSLAWNFSRGRGYRDFRPGSVHFLPLRRGRIPELHNNSLIEAPRE